MGGPVSLKYYACIWFVLKDIVTLRNVEQVCCLKCLNKIKREDKNLYIQGEHNAQNNISNHHDCCDVGSKPWGKSYSAGIHNSSIIVDSDQKLHR